MGDEDFCQNGGKKREKKKKRAAFDPFRSSSTTPLDAYSLENHTEAHDSRANSGGAAVPLTVTIFFKPRNPLEPGSNGSGSKLRLSLRRPRRLSEALLSLLRR